VPRKPARRLAGFARAAAEQSHAERLGQVVDATGDGDMFARAGVAPRNVDIQRLQCELRNQGVYLRLPSEVPAAQATPAEAEARPS